MTTFLFQGLNPTVPIAIWAAVLILCLGAAWWSYAYLESVTAWKKWSLVGLRAGVFTILAILLLNPFFIDRSVERSEPKVNIYLDNSQSVSVERGDYQGLDSYREIINRVRDQLSDTFVTTFYLFDGSVRQGTEPEAEGSVTDLQTVLDHNLEQPGEVVASLLLSDGIYTQGKNPVFSAESVTSPVFTVPVGDTTKVQDVLVANTEYTSVSYTNTEQQFRTEIQQEGFAGKTADVQFLKEGRIVDSQSITFPESVSSHTVQFTDRHEEEGFYEYEINIPGLEDEFTLQNNRERLTVDVLDEKTRIVSLAFEVHPDVGTMRRLIATDSQIELFSATRLSDRNLTGEDPRELDFQPDLILLHGLPAPNDPLLSWIEEQNEVPVLYVLTPNAQPRHEQLGSRPFLTYSVATARQSLLNLHLKQELDPYSHPLLEFSAQEFRRFPTLQSYRSEYNTSPLSETLFTGEFQREETDIPLVITESAGTRRLAGINAFGWYRFETTANENVSSFFTRFFTDLISWVATSPNQRNLDLEPVKSTFTDTEEIEIRATLVNERQEAEPNAVIELNLRSLDSDESRTLLMSHNGRGNYRVSAEPLPEGNYIVEGEAVKNDRTIGEDQARFDVSRSMIEFVDTRRNDNVLQQIAIRSGGEFLHDYSLDPLYDYLRDNQLDEAVETVTEETQYMSSNPLWFILVILMLTGEWLLRRTVSLP